MRSHIIGIIAFVAALAAASCSINRKSSQYECSTTGDCDPGRVCSQGLCIVAGGPDAPQPPRDAGDVDAPDDPGECPAQCTECSDGKGCTIDCAAGGDCDGPIACPSGWNCLIRCNEQDGCRNGIDCSSSLSCDVQCTAAGTCRGVECGPGRCNLNCVGQNSCRNIDCGESCACDVKCAVGSGCSGVQCSELQCISGFGGCTSQGPGCNTCQ